MGTPTIPNGEEHFFPIIYQGNGAGQRVGKFVPFTDNGTIANSVIFNDDDNAYLSRTNDAGDRDTFTISVWVKRGNLGSVQHIFDTYDGSSSNDGYIRFNADNTISTRIGSPSNHLYTTNRTFEDVSKWYHIMLSVNTNDSTAADRVKLYVDGDRITSFSTQTNAGSADDTQFNYSSATFRIGSTTGGSYDFDGYLAEFNQVDGTALAPSTFGVTDTSTGRWIPKTLSGITYGTNGFRLEFGDSSALGDDTSGNTNDFTATNLASTDQTTDSPTQNHSTFSPLADETTSSTLSEGNLTTTQSSYGSTITNLALPSSGKYYWEFKATSTMDGNTILGVQPQNGIGFSSSGQFPGGSNNPNSFGFAPAQTSDAQTVHNSVFENCPTLSKTTASGTYIQMCWDGNTGSLWFGMDNTFEGNPSAGTGASFTGINSNLKLLPAVFSQGGSYEVNFGQRGFQYTPPTGFVALQQDNLPETDKGIPGMAWFKHRDGTGNHLLIDSSRGGNKQIQPNLVNAELTQPDMIQKFLLGGYSVEDFVNLNNADRSFVSWNWVANGGTTATNEVGAITSTVQANTDAGFSIVEYTGTGGAASVGHGLSAAPEWMIFKDKGNSTAWRCYHKSLGGITKYIVLNTTAAVATASMWGAPTASAFIIGGTGYEVNESGNNYIAYCWHSVDGFSKFGSYEGNASADGPFVYLGFRPAFLMIKNIDRTVDWIMIDSKRDPFNNDVSKLLKPNEADAESEANNKGIDLLSNGFKIRQSSSNAFNASSETHIYMAFAEHPFVGDGTSPVTAR